MEVPVEVILRQAVENLGHPGDVVTVSNGYARNYLLPRGVAFLATEGNKKRISQEKVRLEAAEASRREARSSSPTSWPRCRSPSPRASGEEGQAVRVGHGGDIAQQLEAQGITSSGARSTCTSRSRPSASTACRSGCTPTSARDQGLGHQAVSASPAGGRAPSRALGRPA
jgi:large subunit ribosomal protein L9